MAPVVKLTVDSIRTGSLSSARANMRITLRFCRICRARPCRTCADHRPQ